jgi:hypothetical protein
MYTLERVECPDQAPPKLKPLCLLGRILEKQVFQVATIDVIQYEVVLLHMNIAPICSDEIFQNRPLAHENLVTSDLILQVLGRFQSKFVGLCSWCQQKQ